MKLRRTKIVATLGPATDPPGMLDLCIESGMDVARINFSYDSHSEHQRRCDAVREAAERHGRPIGVLADLSGPKIRIEKFVNKKVFLEDGAGFTLDAALGENEGDDERVGITYKDLPSDVSPGDTLLLDDGNIALSVDSVGVQEIETHVLVGGELSDRKGINRLGGGLSAGAFTDKDFVDIKLAGRIQADYLAVSFCRNAEDIEHARSLFQKAGGRGGMVAKIERVEALENIDEITQAADVVMIARGDLGVEIGDAELAGVQKRVIHQVRTENRIAITATQMMQSMVESAQPTRAEVLDVANAVLDGTDAVMLSAETSVGRHPHKVITAMDRITRGAETQRAAMVSSHRMESTFEATDEAIAMAAMYTANHLGVDAIVALTESGATVKWMSRISSGIPIFALTRHIETRRRVTLYRGVYPMAFDSTSSNYQKVDQEVITELKYRGVVKPGDTIIITKGDLMGTAGGTDTLRILRIGED